MSSGQPFIQIEGDGGFLKAPVVVKELLLGPGERADVILDFSGHTGQNITITNDAPAPFPAGDPVDDNTGQIMQFRVCLPLLDADDSSVPSHLVTPDRPSINEVVRTRSQTLVESQDEFGRLLLLLKGEIWDDPITDKVQLDSVEIWQIVNPTPDTHPIHLHLVRFFILDRRPFDAELFMSAGEIVYTGPALPPDSNEQGPKDTVRSNPGEVTRIIARFGDFEGIFPWHCHILEHEDHEMMRPYEVVDVEPEE